MNASSESTREMTVECEQVMRTHQTMIPCLGYMDGFPGKR